MASLLADCKTFFGSDDLYTVLNVDKKASENTLKRAYHKLSLKVHPDRVSKKEKTEATQKFQTLGRIYALLSDPQKRGLYDESGEIDDENDVTHDRDWYDYWRILFKKISVQDIKEFEEKYKGSAEEISDVTSAYLDFEGDMDQILENVMCATIEDEDRFRDILKKKIKKKEIPAYDIFTKENAKKKKQRQAKATKEAAEAEEMKAELGLGSGDDALKQLIQQRQAGRQQQADDFFAQLEAKYAPPKKKGKAKK